jgi:multiple sugar transport system substrate-binding protein
VRRRVLLGSAAGGILPALVPVLAACSGLGGALDVPAPARTGGPIWILDQGNAGEPANKAMLDRRFAEFEAANPGTKVSFEFVTPSGGTTEMKFGVLQAAGTLPDVICTHTAVASQVPHLADLSPYLAKDRRTKASDYFPTALEAFKVATGSTTRQIAIPREVHISLLYYNRDLHKAAGVTEPTRDWTLAQFVDHALKLTKVTRTTNDPATASWALWGLAGVNGGLGGSSIFWQHGAEFFSADGKQCLIDRPEAREALQWLADLVHKHRVETSPKEDAASGLPALEFDKFATGRLVMYVSGVNASPLRAAGAGSIDWDIQALPQVPGKKRASRMAAPGYGLLNQGQNRNPDLGWEVIKYLVGEEGAKRWIEASGTLMAHKKASEEWAKHRGPSKNSKVAFDIMEQWGRLEQVRLPGWAQAMAPINREWTAVRNGDRSIGDAITVAKAESDAALARAQSS